MHPVWQNDQWVSHVYVYRSPAPDGSHVAGKLVVCANRYGKTGCGHPCQLYLIEIMPKRQYRFPVVIAFMKALLSGRLVAISQIPIERWRLGRNYVSNLFCLRQQMGKLVNFLAILTMNDLVQATMGKCAPKMATN